MKYIAHMLEFSCEQNDKLFSCIIPRNSYDENKDLNFKVANRILEKLRYENLFNKEIEYSSNVEYDNFIEDISSEEYSLTQGLCTDYFDDKPDEEIIFSDVGSLKEYNEYLKKSMKDHEQNYPQCDDEFLSTQFDPEV